MFPSFLAPRRGSRFTTPLLLVLLALGAPRPAEAAWSQSGNLVANSSFDDFVGTAWPSAATTMALDNSGGVFVIHITGSNGDSLRVNRIDADTGDRLWGADGVSVNPGGNLSGAAKIVADGTGGCYVVWEDSRSGAAGIYAERFNSSGVRQGTSRWTAPSGPAASFARKAAVLLE